MLLVVCDYDGRLRYTMTSTWRPISIDERRGQDVFVLDGEPDADGRVAVYRQVKGKPKQGPPRCAD